MEVQDIWTSPDSFAWELLRLLEVTAVCYLLSREIPLQESYLEQPCEGQFHYGDDCKGLVIPEAIGTFSVCPVVGEELGDEGSI